MVLHSRRQFLHCSLVLAGLGFLAGCGVLGRQAQPLGKVARIGVLSSTDGPFWDALRQGLRELGYVDGQNLGIEYRWSEGNLDQLPALAAELVRLEVGLIVVSSPQPTAAVQAATMTIPIVFLVVADPVGLGFVSSLARPGGNITGFSTFPPEGFTAKQLELLDAAVPGAARIAILVNPSNPIHRLVLPQTMAAADKLGVTLQIIEVRDPEELDGA